MRGCLGNQESGGTHLLSTAISFSMLLSFPFRAFLGMHLTANMRPLSLSWARTTSEKAPLWKHQRPVIQEKAGKGKTWRSRASSWSLCQRETERI